MPRAKVRAKAKARLKEWCVLCDRHVIPTPHTPSPGEGEGEGDGEGDADSDFIKAGLLRVRTRVRWTACCIVQFEARGCLSRCRMQNQRESGRSERRGSCCKTPKDQSSPRNSQRIMSIICLRMLPAIVRRAESRSNTSHFEGMLSWCFSMRLCQLKQVDILLKQVVILSSLCFVKSTCRTLCPRGFGLKSSRP